MKKWKEKYRYHGTEIFQVDELQQSKGNISTKEWPYPMQTVLHVLTFLHFNWSPCRTLMLRWNCENCQILFSKIKILQINERKYFFLKSDFFFLINMRQVLYKRNVLLSCGRHFIFWLIMNFPFENQRTVRKLRTDMMCKKCYKGKNLTTILLFLLHENDTPFSDVPWIFQKHTTIP